MGQATMLETQAGALYYSLEAEFFLLQETVLAPQAFDLLN